MEPRKIETSGGRTKVRVYEGGAGSRFDMGAGVLSVGTEPAHLNIGQHSEMAYWPHYPQYVMFECRFTGLQCLAMAAARQTTQWRRRRLTADPMHLPCLQLVAVQQRIVVPLRDRKDVVSEILSDHVPRLVRRIADAPDAEALALSQCVIHEPLMPADPSAIGGMYFTGIGRQIA